MSRNAPQSSSDQSYIWLEIHEHRRAIAKRLSDEERAGNPDAAKFFRKWLRGIDGFIKSGKL